MSCAAARGDFPAWKRKSAAKPATASACLAHCRDRMTPADYWAAIEQIELLIAAERFDAAMRFLEVVGSLEYKPLAADEIGS